jgi:3-oxoacyl-[acyl-carrier-protein] synthase II
MSGIVISGMGVISPLGVGRDAYWEALTNGRSGVSAVNGIGDDAEPPSVPEPYRYAGQIRNYEPAEILGTKGLRFLNDAAKLLIGAAELARQDAKLEIGQNGDDETADAEKIGVVVGTSLSNVWDCTRFYESLLQEGESLNPLRFPNVFINIAGGNLAIRFGARGINTTVTNGATSSLDAMGYALGALRSGRAEIMLVGAIECLSPPLLEGFWRAGLLGDTTAPLPFDRRRRGMILGEGAGVLVLEKADAARARGARVYGEVVGYGSAPVDEASEATGLASGIEEAMRRALRAAEARAEDVDYLAAGANSSFAGDRAEARAIQTLFGRDAPRLRTSTVKSMLGEAYSASGLLQVIACLLAAEQNLVPPTVNCEEEDPECHVPGHVRGESAPHRIRVAMANSFGSGRAASLVVRQ